MVFGGSFAFGSISDRGHALFPPRQKPSVPLCRPLCSA